MNAVDAIIRAAILDLALTAVKVALIAEFPVLGLPVINPIFNLAIDSVGRRIYRQLTQVANITILSLKTDEERDQYAKAESELRSAHLSGNAQLLHTATDNFRARLGSLVHYDAI